jgi:hypothetical protein
VSFRDIFRGRVYRLSSLQADAHHGDVHRGREARAWADFDLAYDPRLHVPQLAPVRTATRTSESCIRNAGIIIALRAGTHNLPASQICPGSPPGSCCLAGRISSRSLGHLLHSFWSCCRLGGACPASQSDQTDTCAVGVVGVVVGAGATASAGHEGSPAGAEASPPL